MTNPFWPGSLRRGSIVVKLGIAVAAVGLVGAGSWYVVRAAEDAGMGHGTDVVQAEVRDFSIETVATGELEARDQVEIRNELDMRATIVEVIKEGTRVAEGDVLVRLNSEQIEEQITEEESRVETARADLEAAENAYLIQISNNDSALRAAMLELELAELALMQWREGDDKKMQEQLASEADSARRTHERLSTKFEQSEQLFAKDFKSKNDFEQEQIDLLEAESKLKQATLALEIYVDYQRPRDEKQKTSDVEEAKAKVERVKKQNEIELASKDASRKNARRQLELREERLTKLQDQLEACTLTAPSAGLVVYQSSTRNGRWRNPDPPQAGTEVSPNEIIMVLPDTTEMVASVRVHESLAGRLSPGQPARVKMEALDSRVLSGRVESVGVLAESGSWRDPNLREYTVRIAIDAGEDDRLKPSMRAEATIVLDEVDDALTVPVQAIFNEGRLRYVFIPEGRRFGKVPVRVGRRSETHAEIRAGLGAGDAVLVRSPEAGEILARDWDASQLEAVGFRLDESGQPVPAPREGRRAASAAGGDASKSG
ncbi:MAG: HlyD family efflux transporter periplasmic adaptor subunit [Planctomycetota bacterium]